MSPVFLHFVPIYVVICHDMMSELIRCSRKPSSILSEIFIFHGISNHKLNHDYDYVMRFLEW